MILMKARGLYLPFVRAENADLWESDLRGADLWRARLWGVCFKRSDLKRSDLRKSDVWGAEFEEADFGEADIRDVRNLDYALYLKNAHFERTRVTKKEKAIIEEALGDRQLDKQLFVVE